MVANTGTYVDAPLHRFADGDDLSELPLETLADLETVVVRVAGSGDARDRRGDRLMLAPTTCRARRCCCTPGDAARFGTPEYVVDPAYLTRARRRLAGGAGRRRWSGIDAANIDDMTDGQRPAAHPAAGGRDPDRRAPARPGAAAPASGPASPPYLRWSRASGRSRSAPSPRCSST